MLINTDFQSVLKSDVKRKIQKLLKILLKYQNKNHNNIKVEGSFYWGKTSQGKLLKHPNSWVTFFSIQSLILLKSFLKNEKSNFDSFDLV